jgi:uncharacterized protein YggL (DUF469 family)
MKKRLRKKLHKGEFKELGFYIEFDFLEPDNDALFDKFWDNFIEEGIVGNGLVCGGGGYKRHEYFVSSNKGSASEKQRNALKEWLEKQPDISNIMLGEFKDAWY